MKSLWARSTEINTYAPLRRKLPSPCEKQKTVKTPTKQLVMRRKLKQNADRKPLWAFHLKTIHWHYGPQYPLFCFHMAELVPITINEANRHVMTLLTVVLIYSARRHEVDA